LIAPGWPLPTCWDGDLNSHQAFKTTKKDGERRYYAPSVFGQRVETLMRRKLEGIKAGEARALLEELRAMYDGSLRRIRPNHHAEERGAGRWESARSLTQKGRDPVGSRLALECFTV
jgi:hypothetical protein